MKVNNLRADKMRQFSLMKSYKWCGKTLLKMKKYKEAVIMFEESSSICKTNRKQLAAYESLCKVRSRN